MPILNDALQALQAEDAGAIEAQIRDNDLLLCSGEGSGIGGTKSASRVIGCPTMNAIFPLRCRRSCRSDC